MMEFRKDCTIGSAGGSIIWSAFTINWTWFANCARIATRSNMCQFNSFQAHPARLHSQHTSTFEDEWRKKSKWMKEKKQNMWDWRRPKKKYIIFILSKWMQLPKYAHHTEIKIYMTFAYLGSLCLLIVVVFIDHFSEVVTNILTFKEVTYEFL